MELEWINIIEILGSILGLLGVYLSGKNNKWGFIWGLMSTLLYILICAQAKLYGSMFLNTYYSIMNIIGFMVWNNHEKKQKGNKVSNITFFEWIVCVLVLLAGGYVIGWSLTNIFHSNLPFLDAYITVASFIAMWLLIKHKIENWLWWILINIFTLYLYFQRELYFTSLQYLILMVLAIMGFLAWRKKIKIINNHIH